MDLTRGSTWDFENLNILLLSAHWYSKIKKYTYKSMSMRAIPASEVDGNAHGPGVVLAETGGLDLLQGESTSSPTVNSYTLKSGNHKSSEVTRSQNAKLVSNN